MIRCPKCLNAIEGTIRTWNHRREQMNCFCLVCNTGWVHIFKDVPKEDLVPKEIKK